MISEAQRLNTPFFPWFEIDYRELEVIPWCRSAALEGRSHVISGGSCYVLPAGVGGGDAGGVAVWVGVCSSVVVDEQLGHMS